MKELTEKINKILKPVHDFQRIIEPTRRIQESMQPIIKMQKSLENIAKVYKAAIPKFEFPFKDYATTFKRIEERLKAHRENTPRYLLLIAEHGWFIDFDSEITFPHRIVNEIEEGNRENAEKILEEYYTSNLDRIGEELKGRHYERKDILHELIEGHKNGKFYLTIPTILSQVDGICFDFTEKKFFIKERKNNYLPQVTSELETLSESVVDLFLSPIKNQTPIMVREKDIQKYPCTLNRHEILHGVSKNYGTERNSLKCLSLLKYISDLLIETEKKNTKYNNV